MTKEIFEAKFNADEVTKFLNDASKKISDLRPLMRVAAQYLKFVVDENFETEGTFTGEKWKEWSDKYKKQRMKQSRGQGKILTLEGSLRKDIRSKYDNTTASVIANKEYAAVHNFGLKRKISKTSSKGKRFKCNMNMPKREFMRINEREQENLIGDLTVKLTEMLLNNGHSNG